MGVDPSFEQVCRKYVSKDAQPAGLIDVARVVSVGQDRASGEAILRFRDQDGRLVAVRLKPRQFGTLARGVLGLFESQIGSPSRSG